MEAPEPSAVHSTTVNDNAKLAKVTVWPVFVLYGAVLLWFMVAGFGSD